MNRTPLEDQVHDSLHRTVDPLERTPFTIGDVRTRARRIQRRRAAVAGAAVAAVVAVAVPIGLGLVGPAQRSEVPPATRTPLPSPTPTGTVRIDPRSAEVVDSVGVPLVDVDAPSLITPERTIELPKAYDTITPYRDGWIAVANDEGNYTLEILDAELELVEPVRPTGGVVVSPDGGRVAWSEYDDVRWQVKVAEVAAGPVSTYLDFPPSPQEHRVAPIGFVSDVDVVATQDHGDGSTSTFIADGDAPTALPGPISARSASPVAGTVAAFISSDVEGSCSAVVDGTAPSGTVVWETCDYALDHFSPDGQHVVGTVASGGEYGSPTLAVLDAATGEVVVDFEVVLPRRRVGGVNETNVLWEDHGHLVARVWTSGEDSMIVRLGLDGTVQRLGIASAGASGLSMAEVR
jgi:hypothetical protein